jgi:hypothetical protein
MSDISALSKNYSLTTDQVKDLEQEFLKLPAAQQKSFGQADFERLLANKGYVVLVKTEGESPDLQKPKQDGSETMTNLKTFFSGFDASASLGAAVMSLITKNASEQRQVNKEIKAATSEATAQSIEEQAKEMKEKAIIQLVLGVVSGAITIAGGAATAGRAGAAATSGLSDGTATLTNTKIGAQQQAYGGAASIVDTVSQFVGTKYDAKIKELEAETERSRASVDSLKDFNDSLTELIRKCLDTAQSMADNTNQARAKILG